MYMTRTAAHVDDLVDN